jgi:hypothetical protein
MYLTRIRILDKDAEKQMTSDPASNTYFPYKFTWRGWKVDSKLYNLNNPSLPEEFPNVRAYFFEYTRVR